MDDDYDILHALNYVEEKPAQKAKIVKTENRVTATVIPQVPLTFYNPEVDRAADIVALNPRDNLETRVFAGSGTHDIRFINQTRYILVFHLPRFYVWIRSNLIFDTSAVSTQNNMQLREGMSTLADLAAINALYAISDPESRTMNVLDWLDPIN